MCNRLQPGRLCVIDYQKDVIDYNAPLVLINSNFIIHETLIPKFSFCHNLLISYPNHIPQSPKFIFFHSLSFQPIEILNKSLKWWNHQRSKKVLQVEANGTPRLRIFLFLPLFPPPHCSHELFYFTFMTYFVF